MNRFRKQYHERESEEPASRPPLREYKDDSQGTPPSMSFFRIEVTAYWLLPLVIFCAILLGGIYLVVKFDVFTEGGKSLPAENRGERGGG